MRRLLIPLLAAFVLVVSFVPSPNFLYAQLVDGNALLSWTPPTTNEDGSSLTNLSHYMAYYGDTGQDPAAFSNQVQIGGNLTAYMIEGLPPGTWCFAMKAVNTEGLESSAFSNVACKTIEALVDPPSPPKAPGGLAAS